MNVIPDWEAAGDQQTAVLQAAEPGEPDAAGAPEQASAAPGELMAEIAASVRDLAESAERYHVRAEQREAVIDHLHAEVDRLRRGERRGLLRPLLVEMCRLRNDLLRQAGELPADFDARAGRAAASVLRRVGRAGAGEQRRRRVRAGKRRCLRPADAPAGRRRADRRSGPRRADRRGAARRLPGRRREQPDRPGRGGGVRRSPASHTGRAASSTERGTNSERAAAGHLRYRPRAPPTRWSATSTRRAGRR